MIARLTLLPLIGPLLRKILTVYGLNSHHGYVLTLHEAESIVDISSEIALGPCSCRQVMHNCDTPVMTEILVGSGPAVFPKVRHDGFTPISREEAKELLRECSSKKLMHTLVNCSEHFYAICNCCNCCCIPLLMRQKYKIRTALLRDKNIVEKFRNNIL